jgi:phosphatidylinositol 4-phosphatase
MLDQLRYFNSHIQEQLKYYQAQLIVNLLDERGVELELSNLWEEHVKNLNDPAVQFEGFDFHLKCKSSYDNVTELIDKLRPDLEKMGIFHLDPAGSVLTQQTGAVRTNCLDCLDRTNLVQSFFGRHALAAKLRLFGIDYFDAENVILERIFKEAWANNGDAVSLQYAGTAALKSDFTRTGQRETKGVLKDGVNSLSRYWMNTFRDNMRQLGIDLFLGIYDLRANATHDDLDDDIVSQSGLWNEQQLQAIEACTTFLEQELLKNTNEEEDILNAYVVISTNKFGAEQERVLAVTNRAVYRFKYNFNNNKNPIDHFKRLPLAGLKAVQLGLIASTEKRSTQQFGIVLDFGDSVEKSQHIYSALDFSKENAERIVEALKSALKSLLQTDLLVKQTPIQRQTSFGSGIFNALGLGMYNKGKKEEKASSSSSSSSSSKASPDTSKKSDTK